MEMEFKDTGRRRRLTLVLIGAVLAAAAGIGAFTLSLKRQSPRQRRRRRQSWLRRATYRREQLSPTTTSLCATCRGRGSVAVVRRSNRCRRSRDLRTDLCGSADHAKPLCDDERKLRFQHPWNDDHVTADSPTWRAVSINIPAERAVGGEVKAGQHVDLIVSVEIKVINQAPDGSYVDCGTVTASQYQCGKSTKITLQDIEVLKALPDDDLYVFKVDLAQAEQISHVIQEAPDAFTMVLRPDEDTRPVDESQYGTTTDRLIMTYLFPAPQMIDLSQLLGPSFGPVPNGSPIPGGGGSSSSPAPSGSPQPGESTSPKGSPGPGASFTGTVRNSVAQRAAGSRSPHIARTLPVPPRRAARLGRAAVLCSDGAAVGVVPL